MMKRWLGLGLVLCFIFFALLWMRPERSPFLGEQSSKTKTTQILNVKRSYSSVAPVTVPVPVRAPSAASKSTLSLYERMDFQRVYKIGNKKYKLLEGKLAMSDLSAQRLGLRPEKRIGSWVIVDEKAAGASEKSYPLMQREGSAVVGVFRGVLKTQSIAPLRPQDTGHCPGSILSSSHEINVYLFELNSASSPEELKDCLTETSLFKYLEWEVLDQPRSIR